MTNRSLAVGGALQLRDVLVRAIVERLDLSFGERHSDEHRDDGLRHRVGGHPVIGRAVVLIALREDGVVLQDQQPCGAGAGQVVVQPRLPRLVRVLGRGLGRRALQKSYARASGHLAGRKDFVEVADQAHQAARLRPDQGRADRIALSLAERLLVGRGERRRGEEQACGKKDEQPDTALPDLSGPCAHPRHPATSW